MSSLSERVNLVILKFSVNKWEILNTLKAQNFDELAVRYSWDEILKSILASESYIASTIKKIYREILKREAESEGLSHHVQGYLHTGWRSILEPFLNAEEYWAGPGQGEPASFLSAVWRYLADGDDLPDRDDLAAALRDGSMARYEAVQALLSRPEVVIHESNRLWQRLTGASQGAPDSVISALENRGREDAIRVICDLPEFESFAARNGSRSERGLGAARAAGESGPSGELNPYKNRPAYSYWKSGVAESGLHTDPVVGTPLSISRSDPIATAGSCFAQHLSKALAAQGYRYLVTEQYQPQQGVADEGYGVYPARFGNIYTARHLLQLFERAYGMRVPHTEYWQGEEGRIIDPFRPRIQEGGFPDIESLLADRERHYRAVRQMFEQCRVFIFTLGLTESWISSADGSVYPLAPGVVASRLPDDAVRFHNFSVGEVSADLDRFLTLLAEVNPQAKVILTVSPVPLIATFEERHVLVSTIASKSILRAAADEICRLHQAVIYFPSYEIITGPQTGAKYYREDLRDVSEEGVAFVMSVFAEHFLSPGSNAEEPPAPAEAGDLSSVELREEDLQKYSRFSHIVCDEELIVR